MTLKTSAQRRAIVHQYVELKEEFDPIIHRLIYPAVGAHFDAAHDTVLYGLWFAALSEQEIGELEALGKGAASIIVTVVYGDASWPDDQIDLPIRAILDIYEQETTMAGAQDE